MKFMEHHQIIQCSWLPGALALTCNTTFGIYGNKLWIFF